MTKNLRHSVFHGGDLYSFAQKLGCTPKDIIDFLSNIHFQQAVDWHELANVNLMPY